ncbi:MAG: hypothetical protein RLZZ410_318 [Pseudomonadota bacterium]|jgi:methionyl-tRNA formyltransferase
MLRVVFAGTPDFAKTALASIIDAGHQVVMVMTQPDRPAGRGMNLQASPVKELALSQNIPVIQPSSLKIDGKYGEEAKLALQALEQVDFDVMVVAAYGLILPPAVFDITERQGRAGCLNIHASLLPRWRGAAPIHRAIEAGDQATGISIMQMDLGLDTGPVIAMKEVAIAANETTGHLHDRLASLGGAMIVMALNEFEKATTLGHVAQADVGITYAHKITKNEARLDWALGAQQLDCKIRAFNPYPGTSFEKDGLLIKAWGSQPLANHTHNKPPGEIISLDKLGVIVATGEGALLLTELQKSGGKKISASQLAQNLLWAPGQHFE